MNNPDTRTFNLVISPEDAALLEAKASRAGISKAAVIKLALRGTYVPPSEVDLQKCYGPQGGGQ